MTIFSLLLQGVLILILGLSFLIGIVIMIIGFWKTPMNKKQILKGFSLFIFPLLIFIYYSIKPLLLYEVEEKEIVGVYKVSKSSTVDVSNLEKVRLKINPDGTFYLNEKIPEINICQQGKFEYSLEIEDENALSFYCENGIIVEGIKRNFTNFELEFMIGDPDSNEVIYLEKIN